MDIILGYLEIAVTEECNLNCKACSHFSPLANGEDKVSLGEFTDDIKRIRELFPVIYTIRLLGGEPLLNEDVFEMAKLTRSLYPKSRIAIVTNGLLIPSVKDEDLSLMVQNNIEFDISLYKPTARKKDEIDKKCDRYAVTRNYTPLIETFRLRFDPEGNNDGALSYSDCVVGKRCTYLYKGKLSGCPAPNVIHLYNRRFNTNISSEDDLIDIHHTTLSAEEIVKKIRSCLSVCKYCSTVKEIPWSTIKKGPHPDDWFVKEDDKC